jgi:glycosyltransferase involved in cell wall biosynthesis
VSERSLPETVAALRARGIDRVHLLAWRDLEDPDAGGSELHAHQLMKRWAAEGLEVTTRTSHAVGQPVETERDGYRVVRRGSRYSSFHRTVAAELARSMGPYDAMVEVWNGVPFLTPLWCRKPRLTLLHHVHGPMWDQLFPPKVAALGKFMETRLAPPLYRRGTVVCLGESTRHELLGLGFKSERVVAVPVGTPEWYTPGADRSPTPLVVAVGRLAPVKRFDALVHAVAATRVEVPDVQLVIVGVGPERENILRAIDAVDGRSWVTLTGWASSAELLEWYQRAWVVASASLAEGWGMSLTEGAACATPAVATDISGHQSSVVDGVTGLLAPLDALDVALTKVLIDPELRARLGAAALDRAQSLSWDRTVDSITGELLAVVERRRWPLGRRATLRGETAW